MERERGLQLSHEPEEEEEEGEPAECVQSGAFVEGEHLAAVAAAAYVSVAVQEEEEHARTTMARR